MTLDPDQLAELARNRGLKLRRSRVRSAGKPGFGRFGLVSPGGEAVFGVRGKALEASAEEIAEYLRGLEQQDWTASLREAGATPPKRPGKRARAEVAVAPPPSPPPPAPMLRDAKGRDAEQLAGLFALLDHRIAPQQVKRNLKVLAKAGEPVLVVAEGERLLGACGYHATPMPHRDPPVGRITVLVIAERRVVAGWGGSCWRRRSGDWPGSAAAWSRSPATTGCERHTPSTAILALSARPCALRRRWRSARARA